MLPRYETSAAMYKNLTKYWNLYSSRNSLLARARYEKNSRIIARIVCLRADENFIRSKYLVIVAWRSCGIFFSVLAFPSLISFVQYRLCKQIIKVIQFFIRLSALSSQAPIIRLTICFLRFNGQYRHGLYHYIVSRNHASCCTPLRRARDNRESLIAIIIGSHVKIFPTIRQR